MCKGWIMDSSISKLIRINPAVKSAIRRNAPIVALETAVVTHGLPRPVNYQLACEMEDLIQKTGAQPATIGMIKGIVYCGLTREQLTYLSEVKSARKLSQRDFGSAMATHSDGGTTVAGTALTAHAAGIRVFATGGIGGVHRDAPFDVSADLPVLAKTPLIVVCAGAKAILDLPATLEYLETMGIPILGYQTDEFPAFYSTSSGLAVSQKVDSAEMVVDIARSHFGLGFTSAILVVVPPPAEVAIPVIDVEKYIRLAIKTAQQTGVKGAATTPYLLNQMNDLTDGRSLATNLGLLKNNAHIAAKIAIALSNSDQRVIHA
jgi:pseudouridine-5'-phosphate glycosidase